MAGRSKLDWVADVVLGFGFLCCAGVAVGWLSEPFSGSTSIRREGAAEAASRGVSVSPDDPRFGTWISPAGDGSRWIRTAKISSAGMYGARVTLTMDFVSSITETVVPGVLGEFYVTALMQQDGKGQAVEGGCQVQLEWASDGSALKIRHKGPCGDVANLAPDGLFSGEYRKASPSPGPARAASPAAADCSKLKSVEDKLFCKDPALRVAREVTAAVFADSLSVLRQNHPEAVSQFEAGDKQWQGEVLKVCLATEGTPDDPLAAKSACFSQSYDARSNWLRLHTGLVHLAAAVAKDESVGERYSDALGNYANTYGTLALQLPMFARRLQPIFPASESEALDTAMANRGPRGGLFQSGCGPQGCDLQEGAFEMNPSTGSATVALRQASKITVYSLEGESAPLPDRLNAWLEQRTSHVKDIIYKP